MKLTQENIKNALQALTQGKKVIFKNDEGKVKVFSLRNSYYFINSMDMK